MLCLHVMDFLTWFSSLNGLCVSAKGQTAVLAAHADSLSEGFVRERRIRVMLVQHAHELHQRKTSFHVGKLILGVRVEMKTSSNE